MIFGSWDDAMFWHGSLIGYMAGVKSACKDEDKSHLLLRMADTQARLESMESENAKLRELAHKQDALTKAVHAYWAGGERSLDDFNVMMDANAQVLALMRELGIEVDDGED